MGGDRRGDTPAIGWLAGRAFAHRGLHLPGRPESSLTALAAAAQAGYGVELDVQPIAGGERLAVFHDATAWRMCRDPRRLIDLTAEQLAGLRLAGTGHAPVVDLDAALRACLPEPVLVELKVERHTGGLRRRIVELVADAVARTGAQAALLSFDPHVLAAAADLAPHLPRVQLAASTRVAQVARQMREAGLAAHRRLALEWLAVAAVSRPQAIGYDLRSLDHPVVRAARRLGLPVVAGVATDPSHLELAGRLADAVVFDHLRPAPTGW